MHRIESLDWLTIHQAAAALGVSRQALNYRVAKGEVPGAVRIAGRLYFRPKAFLAWAKTYSPKGKP